jgi:hypothetical protein
LNANFSWWVLCALSEPQGDPPIDNDCSDARDLPRSCESELPASFETFATDEFRRNGEGAGLAEE